MLTVEAVCWFMKIIALVLVIVIGIVIVLVIVIVMTKQGRKRGWTDIRTDRVN